MGFKDFIVTPIFILLFAAFAFVIRPYFTTAQTRKYFLPALWLRFAGAIALGLIYQFYYGGGDTFNYWQNGSQWIWKAFMEDPLIALEMIFGENSYNSNTFNYAQHIWFFRDSDSYFVIRIAGLFDIITFGTYSATALFFAFFSWLGAWALYRTLTNVYPHSNKSLALAILFFPSLVFWGGGLLKDSVSLGALFWLINGVYRSIEWKDFSWKNIASMLIATWLIINVKPYIFYCAVPSVFVWIYFSQVATVKNNIAKILVAPILFSLSLFFGFLAIDNATRSSEYYSLDNIAERAWITAYDIRYYTGRGAGSGYSLGEQDGSIEGMLKLGPEAVFVAIFRPLLWEVNNPFMLIMALESLLCLILFLRFAIRGGFQTLWSDPFLIFCFCFAILFAFAVGVSTYNFGTLMRYRIPLIPFFLIPIFLKSNSRNATDRK